MTDDVVSSVAAAPTGRNLDVDSTLDAWRSRGADRVDPVRFRFIEALARRAAHHDGDARRLLDEKLARVMRAYADEVERASDRGHDEAPSGHGTQAPSVLGELIDHIAAHALSDGDAPTAIGAAAGRSAVAELKALSYFRSTWSKLNTEQRLTQSLARLPENAGPLNSHHLVHRSLTLMRDLSPEYLDKFMGHVDALLWLDQLNSGGALVGKDGVRT